MTEQCFFCDEDRALDRHHIVPRRFGGSDSDENLVTVCPTCHRKLETLYDKRFYDEVGAAEDPTEPPRWWWERNPQLWGSGMTVGDWAEFAVAARNSIPADWDFDKGSFCSHYTMTDPSAVMDEPSAAWDELREHGVIYPRPDGTFDVNGAMVEAYKDAEKPEPDNVSLKELMDR